MAKIKQEESDEDQKKAQNTATGTTQADSVPESANHYAQGTKADPAPGPANDETRRKTTGSPHESAPGSAQAPKMTPRSSAQTSAQHHGPKLDKTTSGSQFRMKTQKFDPQLPIENWICAMEIYMTCYNWSEENIIKVSFSQLLTEQA
jgi:hypothetical protein